MDREGNWTHKRGGCERKNDIRRDLQRRGVTLQLQPREQCVTLMRYRGKEQMLVKAQGRLMKTAGSGGITGRGRKQVACR